MTLVLAWKIDKVVVVIADTQFIRSHGTASEIGPKIFLTPISLTGLTDDVKVAVPPMGFAFAGDSGSGQFTHAMATTCLSHLSGAVVGDHPSVAEITQFYSSCAVRLVEERRRHQAFDRYTFEGIIFGKKYVNGNEIDDAEAYQFKVSIDEDGQCVSSVAEIDFQAHPVFAMGSGAEKAREHMVTLGQAHPSRIAVTAMDKIIGDLESRSVGGCVQGAVATPRGVEIRPVLRHNDREGEYYGIMGASIMTLGAVAGYIPIGTPLMLDYLAHSGHAEISWQ